MHTIRELLCRLGIHKAGSWTRIQVWHHGEYPWEKWTHLCHAYRRGNCQTCGLPSRRLIRLCQTPIYSGPRQTASGYDWDNVLEANRKLFVPSLMPPK